MKLTEILSVIDGHGKDNVVIIDINENELYDSEANKDELDTLIEELGAVKVCFIEALDDAILIKLDKPIVIRTTKKYEIIK